jgi:transposase-like protein
MKTRMGEITFDVPQVREGDFYPQTLEKGLCSERALTLSLAEMYVQGVSTRTVAAIVEQLCGSGVSSSQVSKATAQLEEKLAQWRNSPLGWCTYVWMPATTKCARIVNIRDAAVLFAVGVGPDGKQRVLGGRLAKQTGSPLASVFGKLGETRAVRDKTDRQRRSRRAKSGSIAKSNGALGQFASSPTKRFACV